MRFKFKMNHMLISILPIALAIWLAEFVYRMSIGMEETYGPQGLIAQGRFFQAEVEHSKTSLRTGNNQQAEADARSALARLRFKTRYTRFAPGIIGDESTALLCLSDALSAQNRWPDTIPLLERVLKLRQARFPPGSPSVLEIQDRMTESRSHVKSSR